MNSKLSIWKHITLLNHPKLDRLKLLEILKKKYNIFINWAYDPPLHLQPVYKSRYLSQRNQFLKTENLMKKHFHLPLTMMISLNDAKKIVKTLIYEVNNIVKS